VLELPGGCLCCAVREDLARTLRGLIERRDAGTLRPFRRIVIETSGLADPAPILYTLGADAMLDARLKLGRVVTVIDAGTGADTLLRFAEAARQAAMADALLISKTDLTAFGPALKMALDAVNPLAERIIGREAARPGQVLFGTAADPSPASGGGSGWGFAAAASPEAVHSHGIDTFTLILGAPIGRLDFARALGGLAGAFGSDLLRVKGLIRFADRPEQPALVQAAQHTMFAPEWLPEWPDADHRSRLVFIVHDIPRSEVIARFAAAAPTLIGSQAFHPHAAGAPAHQP
jgi:G3E family GTPase